ncbi:MAG: hypothetical protein ABIJ61_01430 [bacterium]
MDKHIDILGILYIVFGGLGLLIGGFLFFIITGPGLFSGDPAAMTVLAIVGSAVAFFFLIFSVPGIIGGIFLLRRRPWSRILVLVLGFLHLIDFPFGTALGVYTIIVLFDSRAVAIFEGAGQAVQPVTPQ